MDNREKYFMCEIVGYCPFNNCTEGYPCENCPRLKEQEETAM